MVLLLSLVEAMVAVVDVLMVPAADVAVIPAAVPVVDVVVVAQQLLLSN